MTTFKILLGAMGLLVFGYTLVAVSNEGVNLFATTLPSLGEFGWPGQFHLDFATYLVLSGIWVAWRHEFSAAGVALGIAASLLGMIFLSIYLLWTLSKADGDVRRLLLGGHAG